MSDGQSTSIAAVFQFSTNVGNAIYPELIVYASRWCQILIWTTLKPNTYKHCRIDDCFQLFPTGVDGGSIIQSPTEHQ